MELCFKLLLLLLGAVTPSAASTRGRFLPTSGEKVQGVKPTSELRVATALEKNKQTNNGPANEKQGEKRWGKFGTTNPSLPAYIVV